MDHYLLDLLSRHIVFVTWFKILFDNIPIVKTTKNNDFILMDKKLLNEEKKFRMVTPGLYLLSTFSK